MNGLDPSQGGKLDGEAWEDSFNDILEELKTLVRDHKQANHQTTKAPS